jgi:hypothetical protein
MSARSSFLFTTIAAVSFLTIAATSSVVLAQQGPVAACAADIQAKCAGFPGLEAAQRASRRVTRTFLCPANLR